MADQLVQTDTTRPDPFETSSRRLEARATRDGRDTAQPIDVSVCIANWNCRNLLRACLESLHDAPQGVRLETIVVDNASNDRAADMVATEFPEVVLYRNAVNVGFARANNQAALRARGRYLFFLNNDTLVPPCTLRRLLQYADSHPEIGMLGPRLRDGQGRVQISYRLRPTMTMLLHRTCLLRWTGLLRHAYQRYRRQDFNPDLTRPVEVLMGAAMFLPRDVFEASGGWDEHYVFGVEDDDLSVRVGRRHLLVYHPGVDVTHFGRVSTRQHIGYATSQMAIGFVRYLRKTGTSWKALLGYKLLVSLDAPLHFVSKGIQYLWRRSLRRKEKARKSLLAFRGLGHFLANGLVPFWRA